MGEGAAWAGDSLPGLPARPMAVEPRRSPGARVRLLADREGLVVRTVPAVETVPCGWKAWAVPREVAAYAAAWVRGDA